MKRFQGSLAAKISAWAILLIAVFSVCACGVRVVLSFQSVMTDSWQDGHRYVRAVEDRRQELLEELALVCRIGELEERVEDGTADAAVYADLEVLREENVRIEERFSRENTWFRFRLMDAGTGETFGSNLEEDESILKAVREVHRYTFELDEEFLFLYSDRDEGYGIASNGEAGQDAGDTQPLRLVLEYGVPEAVDESIQDEFYWTQVTWELDHHSFDSYLTGFLNLSALALIALIWVLWTAGHKKGTEEIVTTWQERIFFDLYAAAMIAVGVVCVFAAIWAVEQTYYYSLNSFYWTGDVAVYSDLGIMGAAALCTGGAAAGCLLLRTFAVRVKAHCLAKTTLLCRVVTWMVRTIHDFVQSLPITWKALLAFGGYVVVSLFLTWEGYYNGGFLLLLFLLRMAAAGGVVWWTLNYHRLRQGTKTIAKGDLEYQIDTRRMPYDLRLQAEDLNNISAGLSAAVDEKMKSERFKAELITNVSHDLKTPLTSIINYVNLLKNTEQADPKAEEYIEVLDRKSQRLKKLTEDLVEASKASTGVLSVNREKIGMSQLIDQALGEWEEKLTARKLTLVNTLPEGETWVYADGRHLWRVIDNLLSNCAKYAMEGTRVYLDLERGKGQVVLAVKNISREPLNVPPERLMERFVRGDESRTTEGSGLGLSIARSLTELQGGEFQLAVDGDLFKAIVTLPQAN